MTKRISSNLYPAKDKNCKIDVFIAKYPDKKFEELAFVGGFTENHAKQTACAIGADGIIYKSFGEGATVIAIKYTE